MAEGIDNPPAEVPKGVPEEVPEAADDDVVTPVQEKRLSKASTVTSKRDSIASVDRRSVHTTNGAVEVVKEVVEVVEVAEVTEAVEVVQEVVEDNDVRELESSDEDGFKDAQETPASPPPARSLTSNRSTIASVPEVPQSPPPGDSISDHRNSQISITPATTVNGSMEEKDTISLFDNTSAFDKGSVLVLKSPVSSSRRMSMDAASLDEVSLIDELPPAKAASPVEAAPPSPPPAPPPVPSFVESITNRFSRSSTGSQNSSPAATPNPPTGRTRKLSSPFLSSALPSILSPSPSTTTTTTATPPPPKRSPFSWLRSNTSAPATPPAPARRATTSSAGSGPGLAALGANNDLLIHRVGANRDPEKEKEEHDRGMENLRESFKKLREARRESVDATEKKAEDPTPGSPGSAKDATSVAASTKSEDEIDWDLWQAVVDDAFSVASEKPTELNRAIQAGIPPTLRGTIWQSLAASKSLELEAIYREVIALAPTATAEDARPIFGSHWLWDPSPTSSQASSPKLGSRASPRIEAKGNVTPDAKWGKTIAALEKVIKRDLGDRTSFGKYKVDQKALLNVCKAYALFDPAVGYTQGMTFIATVLLLNMSEEEAFCVFVKLMNKYKLRSMFMEKMKGLELRLYQYDRILEDYEPRVAIHLKRQHIESSLYAAQWFLTLFTYKFPLQLVLRVFDLLFSEGLEGPILKFGIVLMKQNAEKILTLEFDTLGPFLKEKLFDVYVDNTPSPSSLLEAGFFGNGGEKEVYRANDLIADAMQVQILPETLERYEREWEEAERVKRETEEELSTLRRNNAALQAKVKKLEETNEELNREYVRIASSEVGLKVQNDALADENEVLRLKIDGLRDMVDRQPQEVEDRLKGEMEALMQKNLQVHHQNQTLEESMFEMEKELVSTKMELATVNEDYDLLKNRWNDLRKALGD